MPRTDGGNCATPSFVRQECERQCVRGAYCETARPRKSSDRRWPSPSHRSGALASVDHELLPFLRIGRRVASVPSGRIRFHEIGAAAASGGEPLANIVAHALLRAVFALLRTRFRSGLEGVHTIVNAAR